MKDYIYRRLHLTRSTDKATSKLIRDLMITGGSIVSMGCLRYGFPETKFLYWETMYTIKFLFQDQLDNFESRGWETMIPELVSGSIFLGDEGSQ